MKEKIKNFKNINVTKVVVVRFVQIKQHPPDIARDR